MYSWKILSQLKRNINKKTYSSDEREDEIISILLKNRGISSTVEKELFFNPPHPIDLSLKQTGIKGEEVGKAVLRIKKAIKNNEFIVVYGDYDADGICATAILWEALSKQYKKVMPYLPDRLDEGYGLSKKGIDAVIEKFNPKLILTVDNGVTAFEEIEYAKSKGIDTIVTDHHLVPPRKPKPYAFLHTTKISGSAVSWFLAREFLGEKEINEKLSLLSIGTVADILSLVDLNRSIVFHGLKELRKTERVGLKALFHEAGLKQEEIDTYHLAYIIGPRINATGRIAHALDSLRLLCTKSKEKAKNLASTLGFTNKKRQKITEQTLLHARNLVIKNYGLITRKHKLLFIYDDSYNQGIIGLVAGKLVEEFYRPSIVLSVGKTYSKGSARSINGFNIISAIRESSDLLIDCGGHPMAAGFTVETVKIEKLKNKLYEIFEKRLEDKFLHRLIEIDCELSLKDIRESLYCKLNKFKPFGQGNPEPLFVTRKLKVKKTRTVGRDGQHLKLTVEDDERKEFEAIAFNLADFYQKLTKETFIDIVYTITKNKWNGEKLELKIRDISYSK